MRSIACVAVVLSLQLVAGWNSQTIGGVRRSLHRSRRAAAEVTASEAGTAQATEAAGVAGGLETPINDGSQGYDRDAWLRGYENAASEESCTLESSSLPADLVCFPPSSPPHTSQ